MDRTNLMGMSSERKTDIEEANKNINENLLISVPIDLLYDGMTIQDDIYDSSGERKLINSGNTLDQQQIERINRLNSGHNTIYVTARTHKDMLLRIPKDVNVEVRQEVEDSTGYTKTKDETFKRLEEIASEKKVDTESLRAVSNDLSEQLETMPQDVVLLLINAMAPVDEYLQRHCVNVGMLNGLIGRWMGMSDAEIDKLVLIGLLHDTGKIAIPPQILSAFRKLTKVEYEIIKTHVKHSYDLLHDFPDNIRVAASCHHERCNGTGYNYKLKYDDIMLEARITAISDTYDALVARRAYQEPQSPFAALALIKKLSEFELDREIVNIFIENIPKDLVGKPVSMSNGSVGVVREYDLDDIAYPTVEVGGRTVKTNEKLFCTSMYNED